jgi:hypothetical protein
MHELMKRVNTDRHNGTQCKTRAEGHKPEAAQTHHPKPTKKLK